MSSTSRFSHKFSNQSIHNTLNNASVTMDFQQINNYDVFLRNDSKDFNLRHHVGNARFLVILSVYMKKFGSAILHNEFGVCHAVVDDIIDTIRHKTFPSGRFLHLSDQNELLIIECEREIHDLVYNKICQIFEKQLSPIEKARFAKSRKIAELRKKPVDLSDRRFIVNINLNQKHRNHKRIRVDETTINNNTDYSPSLDGYNTVKRQKRRSTLGPISISEIKSRMSFVFTEKDLQGLEESLFSLIN